MSCIMKRSLVFLSLLSLVLGGCEEDNQPVKTGFTPIVQSVLVADSQTGEPVPDSQLITLSEDKLSIHLDTNQAVALLLEVSTKDAKANATVVSGSDWMKVRELSSDTKPGQVQRMLVTLSANEDASGRIGVVVLSNDKYPHQKSVVMIRQRGSSSKGDIGEYSPTIISVTAINPMNDQPLPYPKHKTEPPFASIQVDTYDTYTLLLEVLGTVSPAEGRVHQGDWLTLLDQTSDQSETTRTFRLHIQQNASPNPRIGSVELYNSKVPDQKILIEVRQVGKKKLQDPENIRDRLALNYVAEWNVDTLGNFIKTHDNVENQRGLIPFMEARTLFATPLAIERADYILPSVMQWLAIVPEDGVYSRSDKLALSLSETCMVGGRVIESKNDYLNIKATHTTYAIRFKGDKEQQSVWRYVYMDNSSGSGKMLMIEERHMAQGSDWTLETIASDAFWEQDREEVVTRYFSTPGYAVGNFYTHSPDYDDIRLCGEVGIYWTSTSAGEEQAWAMEVLDPQVRTRDFYGKIDGHSMRPFRQTLMK